MGVEPTRRFSRRNRQRVPAGELNREPTGSLPSVDAVLRSRIVCSEHAGQRLTERSRFQHVTSEAVLDVIIDLIRSGSVVGSQTEGRLCVAVDDPVERFVLVLKRTGRAWLVLTVLTYDQFLTARKAS